MGCLAIYGLVLILASGSSAPAQDFRVEGFAESNRHFRLTFPSSTSWYHLIRFADSLTNPVPFGLTSLVVGLEGTQSWQDADALEERVRGYYRVGYRDVSNPADSDADGMDDVWELRQALRPLDPADADEDPDEDGLRNLREFQLGTAPRNADTDGDGVDDETEVFFSMNPTDEPGTSGINRNWLFHNAPGYSSATWELVPGRWERFLMLDFDGGTSSVFVLLPTPATWDVHGSVEVKTRFSWLPPGGGEWQERFVRGQALTSAVICGSAPFHGLPTMDFATTVQVYRVPWSESVGTQQVRVYYAPQIVSIANGITSEVLYLTEKLLPGDAGTHGFGTNNWIHGVQHYAADPIGRDYRFVYAPTRLRNGGFDDSADSWTNMPFWSSFGTNADISSAIRHGDSGRAFVSRGDAGVYQNIPVYPGEELVISGLLYTPSATNPVDPNPLTGNRYGLVAVEYLDAPGRLEPVSMDFYAFYATNQPDVWHSFSITSLVPDRVVSANISLRAVLPRWEVSDGGHVYFDALEVSVSDDPDRDGIPSWWESYHGLDSDDPTDGIADPDEDGVLNIWEYRYSTNPAQADTDGDGIPDVWELYFSLNPTEAADANRDPDGDGLSNLQEYQASTHPLKDDTDRDGATDAMELFDLLSNPRVADFDGFELIQTIAGADTSARGGLWSEENGALVAGGLRGYVDYAVELPDSDVCRLELVGSDAHGKRGWRSFPFRTSLNGVPMDWGVLWALNGSHGHYSVILPWLTAGVHTVRFFWDNVEPNYRVRIEHINLYRLAGSDSDGDGIADWAERRMARISGFDTQAVNSLVSPACVEGRDAYFPMMSTTTGTLHQGAGARWYAVVDLSETGQVNMVVSFQNGGLVLTNQIVWTPLNVLGHEEDVVIRKHDALRLVAATNGAVEGDVTIVILGVTSYVTSVSSPVTHRFHEEGTYTVVGTYSPPQGDPMSSTCHVHVVYGTLDSAPACWAGTPRYWGLTNAASNLVVEIDPRVIWKEIAQPPSPFERAFWITVPHAERWGVVLRAAPGGPIITNTFLHGFRLAAAGETGLAVKDVCDTGDQLIETTLVLDPVLPDLRVEGEVIVGGVTFENGDLIRYWTGADFDALGQLPVRFIRAAGLRASVCHTLDIYDGEDYVGTYAK